MSKESNIFVPIKYTNAMKKLSLYLLLCLLIAACVKNDDKDEPILVTDIVMPAQTSFNPGDKVTIKAQGIQPGNSRPRHPKLPVADYCIHLTGICSTPLHEYT